MKGEIECPVCNKKSNEQLTEYWTKDGWKKRCRDCYRIALPIACAEAGMTFVSGFEIKKEKPNEA